MSQGGSHAQPSPGSHPRVAEMMEPGSLNEMDAVNPTDAMGNGVGRLVDLAEVAATAYKEYTETKTLGCLQRAITVYDEVLDALPETHPARQSILFGLTMCLGSRYDRFEHPDDLRKSIEYCQQIIAATPPNHADRGKYLAQLAAGLAERYYATEDILDLQQAILLSEEVLAVTPEDDSMRAKYLSLMANLLYSRYEKDGDMSDHQQSILYYHEVVATTPEGHPERANYLSHMSTAMLRKFYVTMDISDLQKSVVYSEQALAVLPLGHPHRANYLSELSSILQCWSQAGGDANHSRRAMLYAEEAKRLLAVDGPDRVRNLGRLARFSYERYLISRDTDDIQQAILYQEGAVVAMQAHARRGYIISLLVKYLTKRYERVGEANDLHHAIPYAREALRVTPDGHKFRPDRLIDLAFLLGQRFQRMGNVEDIHEAIRNCEEAVTATPPHDPGRTSHLYILSGLLLGRYQRKGDINDVHQIILVMEDAITATTTQGQPIALPLLECLSTGLYERFKHIGNTNDLQQAILYAEEVLAGMPEGNPQRGRILYDLAFAKWDQVLILIERQDSSDRTGSNAIAAGIAKVVELLRKVWDSTDTHPRRRVLAITFVVALMVFEKDMTTLTLTGGETAVLSKIVYNMKLADIYPIIGQAIGLLPMVTHRTLGWRDQEYELRGFNDLASYGASWGLETGKSPYDVLRLLELSRGIIIGQNIDYRRDLSNLEASYPAKAARFHELRLMVDNASSHGNFTTIGARVESSFDEEVAYFKHRTQDQRKRETEVRKMEEMLVEIRTLPGYEEFQLPPSANDLMAMARDGPIVTFISSLARSDAIIITSSSITSLPLPDLVQYDIPNWLSSREGRRSKKSRSAKKSKWSLMMEYTKRNEQMREKLLWLWNVAVEPVLRELKFTVPLAVETKLPHIWWIGVGPLSMAPFHAAGNHSMGSSQNTLSCVISSYTSSLKALSYARERELDIVGKSDPHLLLVSMANTPGQKDLPDVEKEVSGILDVVEGFASSKHLKSPSAERVLDHFGTYHAIHFACHAISDTKTCSDSHLILLDHSGTKADSLTVERIAQNNTKSSLLASPQLAYLSACSTAQNSIAAMADQTIHIASGFQLAGFSHVLATLFPSESEVCKEVAIDFYRSLFDGQDKDLGHRKVSMAFHEAVKTARDKSPLLPSKWAPFIHLGA